MFGGLAPFMHWALLAAVVLPWLLCVQVWWKRRTRVTALLAAAVTAHLLGTAWNFSFGLSDVVYHQHLYSLALSTLFFILIGAALREIILWLQSSGPKSWPGQLAMIDTLMAAAILGMGVWVLGLDKLVVRTGDQPLLAALSLTYATAQILIASLMFMLLFRGVQGEILRWVGAGLLCIGVADLLVVVAGSAAGQLWPTLLWMWGVALVALGMKQTVRAPLLETASPLPPLPPMLRRGLWRLPHTAVVICCALLLVGAVEGTPRQMGITVGTVAVFGLVMLRQSNIAQMNRRMQAQLEASRRDLEHLAYHDVLTGLPNRAAFTHFFEDSLAEDEPYAIFSLDLNGFKQINDTYGHAVGDQMLQHAAEQLKRSVAAPGRIFRWGGDEFVIVVPGVQRSADAEALARFIAVNIRAPMRYQQQELSVGTSVGYALGRGNRNHETFLGLADHDMYSVKERTGGR